MKAKKKMSWKMKNSTNKRTKSSMSCSLSYKNSKKRS